MTTPEQPVEPGDLDAALRDAVVRALQWTPSVDADAVRVSVGSGTVGLAGLLGSRAERLRARMVAGAVPGVRAVVNRIRVRASDDGWWLSDDQVREGCLRALRLADQAGVGVAVRRHVVTLTGHLPTNAVRRAVRHLIEAVEGVHFVENLLTTAEHPQSNEITSDPDARPARRSSSAASRRAKG